MAAIDLPDTLLELERSAWAEIQRGELTVPTALAVHEATVAFAAEAKVARLDVEEQLKRQVRHPEPAAA